MPLRDQLSLLEDETFKSNVRINLVKIAIDVQGEATNTPKHTDRSTLATNVMTSLTAWVPRFAIACVADGTTNASTNDATLQARISAVWNSFFVTPGI